MHSKQKGNIAQTAIILNLQKIGCNIFTELGDLSKIDLIVEFNKKIITLQCKGIYPKKGVLPLTLTKSGPNYQFRYKPDEFDFFAVCNLSNLDVGLISSNILYTNRKLYSLRVYATKNNQQNNITFFSDFMNLDKILRDYTRNILPNKVEDDDIVQTAIS